MSLVEGLKHAGLVWDIELDLEWFSYEGLATFKKEDYAGLIIPEGLLVDNCGVVLELLNRW